MKPLKLNVFSLILIFIVMPTSFAGNTSLKDWHFAGEQQPYYANLQSSDVDEVKDGCAVWVDSMYKNYVSLNPGFRPLMGDERWRKKWRRSMILYGYGEFQSQNICFYRILRKRMMGLPHEWPRRVLFCGVIARNIDSIEQNPARAAEELFEYAMHKRFSALSLILIWEYGSSPIKFNVDVKYYLQLMIKKNWPKDNRLHVTVERYFVPDASGELSAERKKFVEEAFERGDYQAVLSTTTPCES